MYHHCQPRRKRFLVKSRIQAGKFIPSQNIGIHSRGLPAFLGFSVAALVEVACVMWLRRRT